MRVLVATPVYQDMCHVRMAQGVGILGSHLQARGDVMQWMTVSATYVQVGRDVLVHHFLKGNWDKLLFIDSDIMFEPSQAIRLIDSELDIVAGLYPCKEIYWKGVKAVAPNVSSEMLAHIHSKNMVFRPKDQAHAQITNPQEPIEVTGAATGFMKVEKRVFEKFKESHPEERYDWGDEGKIVRFFKVGFLPDDPSREFYGEDIYFCAMARRLGFQVHVIPSINVGHMGQHIYTGCYWCCQGQMIHGVE